MALGMSVADDLARVALTHYVRGPAFSQTNQDKPLLRTLEGKSLPFSGGKDYYSVPIQVSYMAGVAGFGAGYQDDDEVSYKQSQFVLQAQYAWKEMHCGLAITESELTKGGIELDDGNKYSRVSGSEQDRLVDILENRFADFMESWQRYKNTLLWQDGASDSKAIPGLQSIILDNPVTGTTGGQSRVTYAAWRNRATLNLTASPQNQTLTQFLRREARQLGRYDGARPNTFIAGSDMYDAIESEVTAKGTYTQTGFKGKIDIGVGSIGVSGLGVVEYDPTLDDLGQSKRLYVFDSNRLRLNPIKGSWDKVRNPERPYNYYVFFKGMQCKGALSCRQLNSTGVYSLS